MINQIGLMRHRCTIYGPPTGYDDRGQPAGGDELIAQNVPCMIRPLSGREDEVARQRVPTASTVVEMWGGPKRVTTKHWLVVNGRKLTIGYVEDVDQNGLHLRLTCSEEPQ